jgi:hypothetical protein
MSNATKCAYAGSACNVDTAGAYHPPAGLFLCERCRTDSDAADAEVETPTAGSPYTNTPAARRAAKAARDGRQYYARK